jgi:hypothetical protein
MTLPTRLLGAVALAATGASLAIPSVAGAKAGDQTFQQTFPVASPLCAKVAAGKSKRLKPFTAQVLADCATLQSEFTLAQSTVLAARAANAAQIAADRVTLTASCPPGTPKLVCRHRRRQARDAIIELQRRQVRAARRYYRTIEADRRRFWTAIRALPGERRVREDAPITEQDS